MNLYSEYRENKSNYSLNSLSSSNSFDLTREKSTEDIYLNEIISINNELLSNKIKNHNLFKISAIPEVPEAKQANLDLNIKQKSIMFKFYKSNLTPYRSCARQRSTNYGPEKINKTTQTLETDNSTPNQEISESVIIETKAPVETQFINNFFKLNGTNLQIILRFDNFFINYIKFILKHFFFVYFIYTVYYYLFGLIMI